LEQIYEGMALLLLIPAAGADSAEKGMTGASGGRRPPDAPVASAIDVEDQAYPPPKGHSGALSPWQGTRLSKPGGSVPRTWRPQLLASCKAHAGAGHRCHWVSEQGP